MDVSVAWLFFCLRVEGGTLITSGTPMAWPQIEDVHEVHEVAVERPWEHLQVRKLTTADAVLWLWDRRSH